MKNKIFGYVLMASLLMTGMAIQKNNVPELTEYAYDAVNTKEVSVKKLAVGNDSTTVDVSDTYVQWGIYNGNYRLRFATAVKGPIKSVEYVRTIEGYEAGFEKTKEVTTLYGAVLSGEDVVYYDGEQLTTSESAKGQYYWACYVVEFDKDSVYKASNITANINVVTEDGEQISSVSKTATLNGELQKSVTLSLSSESAIKVYEGEKVTLPSASATIFGENAEVKVTDQDGVEIDVNNYVPQKGENKVTYTVDAPEGLEDVTKTITVFAARKLLSYQDSTFTVSNEYSADENQSITTTNKGYAIATFNLEKSDEYYAEATFDCLDKTVRNAQWGFGMIHTPTANLSSNNFYKDFVLVGSDGNWAHNYGPLWSVSAVMPKAYYSRRADAITLPDIGSANGKVKYAVARKGNVFYTFINDKLMETNTYSPFTNVDTIPGLVLVGDHSSKPYNGNITNAVLKDGSDAAAKIDSLINGARLFDYARLTGSAYDFVNFADDGKSFSYDPKVITSEDGWWQETVKANVMFAGHTVIEFDYTLLQKNANHSNCFFYFVKPTSWRDDPTNSEDIYCFARFNYYGSPSLGYLDLVCKGTNADKVSFQVEGINGMKWDRTNYHVKIEVEPFAGANGRTQFTYTLTQKDGGTYSYSREAAHSNASWASNGLSENYYLCFGSVNTSYSITNFTYYSIA